MVTNETVVATVIGIFGYHERLGVLDKESVLKNLEKLAGGREEIALVCYEKPGDFCHRHIVADWLDQGIEELP